MLVFSKFSFDLSCLSPTVYKLRLSKNRLEMVSVTYWYHKPNLTSGQWFAVSDALMFLVYLIYKLCHSKGDRKWIRPLGGATNQI
jgi:hypothetical protein